MKKSSIPPKPFIHPKHGAYRNELHFELEEALVKEAALRGERPYPAWMHAEHEALLKIVNRERQACGKNLLGVEDIERAERLALGHADYLRKFSLYCSELVES